MTEHSSTECSYHETYHIYPNLNSVPLNAIPLNDQQQFRLNKINKIKDYFIAAIKERVLMSKRLSKYNAFFDYFDKSLIVLSVTTSSTSIASFSAVIRAPVGIVIASFSGILSNLGLKTPLNRIPLLGDILF